MGKIKLHYLIGDVHMGGHDVQRIAKNNRILLEKTDAFEILMVCDNPQIGDMDFAQYFAKDNMEKCEVFVFNCGNYVNSGAEAVEGALKLAKRFTGRTEMISMRRAYHGSTHGAMSMMGTPEGEYLPGDPPRGRPGRGRSS